MPAPTTRTDFDSLGWQFTDRDETWTMQEPYGAFTWYAVNDQPSDKALYDFTITHALALGGCRQRASCARARRSTATP